jgi:GNAT superfamily N-acetyltransferase
VTDAVVLRRIEPDDIEAGLALSRQARWNQTRDDWALLLAMSGGACAAAALADRVVGTVTVVTYGACAWIGMVLVSAEMRGRGIGTMLLHYALDLIGPERTACLDATPLGRPLYERLGFRIERELTRLERPEPGPKTRGGEVTRLLAPADLDRIRTWDEEVFGGARLPLLHAMLRRSPDLARAHEGATSLDGYALGRSGDRFDHAGPIVARTPEAAIALAGDVLRRVGRSAIIDVPLDQVTFREWLHGQGFRPQRPLTRMVRGPARRVTDRDALFATLGPEFG